jgi:hypothetical protein
LHSAFFVELETGRSVGANLVSMAKFSTHAIQKTVKFLCSGFSARSCASSAFVYSVRVVLYLLFVSMAQRTFAALGVVT